MAGGGHGRRSGIPLKDRRPAGESSSGEASTNDPTPSSVKHVWVEGDEGILPGLLIRWRQVASGWQGYVTHPVPDAEGWILIDEWLPADRLRPVDAPNETPPMGR